MACIWRYIWIVVAIVPNEMITLSHFLGPEIVGRPDSSDLNVWEKLFCCRRNRSMKNSKKKMQRWDFVTLSFAYLQPTLCFPRLAARACRWAMRRVFARRWKDGLCSTSKTEYTSDLETKRTLVTMFSFTVHLGVQGQLKWQFIGRFIKRSVFYANFLHLRKLSVSSSRLYAATGAGWCRAPFNQCQLLCQSQLLRVCEIWRPIGSQGAFSQSASQTLRNSLSSKSILSFWTCWGARTLSSALKISSSTQREHGGTFCFVFFDILDVWGISAWVWFVLEAQPFYDFLREMRREMWSIQPGCEGQDQKSMNSSKV